MKLARAHIAGLCAGLLTVVLCAVAIWLLHYDQSIRLALGRGVVAAVPPIAWVFVSLGVVIGGIFLAIPYAFVFELVTRRAGPIIGAFVGLMHAATVWLGIGLASQVFPDLGEMFADEIFILSTNVWAIAAFIIVHVIYGAAVGRIYGQTFRTPEVATRIRWRELPVAEEPTESQQGA